jgi:hypothetical protein
LNLSDAGTDPCKPPIIDLAVFLIGTLLLLEPFGVRIVRQAWRV